MELGGDHRTHNASKRIEVVQPRPRPRADVGVWNRDTTESRKDGHDERVEQHGDLNGGRDGTDELRKSDAKDLDEDKDEELEPGSVETRSALTESNGVDH